MSGSRTPDAGDDWQEVWGARQEALTRTFGAAPVQLLHSPHPFVLGGYPDVLMFPLQPLGNAYVTAELSGKPDACYADYELMICQPTEDEWGPNVISRLAPYTQQAYIAAGETMDIDSAVPDESEIRAFLFDTFDVFRLFETSYELRLCIGITKAELQFKLEHGPERLLAALKEHGVYPMTDLHRGSIPLP